MKENYPEAVIVEIPLINEYGSGYGVKAICFAWNPEIADKALLDKYGEERIYESNGDIWCQLRIKTITAYDGGGNINREWEEPHGLK